METNETLDTMVRVKLTTYENIKKIMENNKVFESAGSVITFAIEQLIKRGSVQ